MYMPGFPSFLASQTFASLGVWVLRMAQTWLVFSISHSPVAIGTVTALQFLPQILMAPFSGVIADRYSNRRVLLVTQSAFCLLLALIAALVALGSVTMGHMYAFALLLGVVGALDFPPRQTFIKSIVGVGKLGNAVSLSSAAFSLAGLLGPMLAAWLIGTLGIAWCFALTSAGYLPNLIVITRTTPVEPQADPDPNRITRQLIEGIRHIASRRRLAVPMTLVALIGMVGTAMPVLLIGFTTSVFRDGASGYAQLMAATALGSFVGSSVSARRPCVGIRQLFLCALPIGLLYMVASMSPSRLLFTVLMFVTGAMTLFFLIAALTMLQLSADDAMRGRVYSIYALALVGGTPIGGPVVGRITEQFGARIGLFTCGLFATVAVLLVAIRLRARKRVETVLVAG